MKVCTKCKVPKELTSYYAHTGTKNRLHSWCKACEKEQQSTPEAKAVSAKWRETNIEYLREYDRLRTSMPSAKAKKKAYDAGYRLSPKRINLSKGISLQDFWPNLSPQECLDNYYELMNNQGGECRICHRHQTTLKRSLAVDHDHITGKVRGLLCHFCNTGLGLFRDNPLLFTSAIKYLETYG